jgi:hypothetical protein
VTRAAGVPAAKSWRWAILVVVVFGGFHIPSVVKRYEPNTWLARDGSFYFTTLLAVAEHGRLEQRALQPASWYTMPLGWNTNLSEDWSNVSLGRDGGWYPKHPILLPILSVPFYWALGTFGSLVANITLNLLFVLLTFRLASRFTRGWIAAIIASVCAALPFVQMMSYSFSNDLLSADLALGALEATLGGWFGTAGVLAGFCIWSRLTNAAIVPGLFVVAWDVGRLKGVRRAVLAALIPLGLFASFNTWAFGAPWITSYQSVIIREGGKQTVASHIDAFNVPWREGLHRLIFDDEPVGVFKSFPPLAIGLLGLVVLAFRKRVTLVVGLLVFCVLPAAAVFTYDWYRPHFLMASFGAAMIGLAAVLELLVPGRRLSSEPSSSAATAAPISPQRVGVGVGAFAVVCLVSRAITHPDANLLSSHIHDGRVFLGNTPCDYWNPQRERWECSHFDPEMWAMSGAILGPPVMVDHAPHRGIWLHPSPTRRWRRFVWDHLNARSVDLEFAMTDDAHPGPVQVEVAPVGGTVIPLTVTKGGGTTRQHVDLPESGGLEIRVRSDQPRWDDMVVEGVLHG